jgi:hypothetical protein
MGLVDLGAHRLRDLSAQEQIHQVVIEGLKGDFPRVRSLDTFPGTCPCKRRRSSGGNERSKNLSRRFSRPGS